MFLHLQECNIIASMDIALIAAMSDNRIIGKDGTLPWRVPSDLKRFKELTMDKVIVMGRKTFESIGSKPLPGRTNIVITKSSQFADQYIFGQPSLLTVTTLSSALHLAMTLANGKAKLTNDINLEEVMIIGGESLYAECLPLARAIYLSTIHVTCEGDRSFPSFDRSEWKVLHSEECADEKASLNSVKQTLNYTYEVLERKP